MNNLGWFILIFIMGYLLGGIYNLKYFFKKNYILICASILGVILGNLFILLMNVLLEFISKS